MMVRLLLYGWIFVIVLLQINCAKEYSFEGGGAPIVRDTIPQPIVVNEFPFCPVCVTNTGTAIAEWSFKSGNSVLCGTADTAIALGNRTAFTYFGPSSCSADTGIVMTIYLDGDTLNRDRVNLQAKGAFYYYDRITPSYIFISQSNNFISVTINRYIQQTRMAECSFQGAVLRSNGAGASITSGKFTVKLL
jgi:hypothetical protein